MTTHGLWAPIERLLVYDPARPLLFHHADFFLCLTVAFLGIACIERRETFRVWLTLFSFFVYYKIAGCFAILLAISISVDYPLARALAAVETPWKRRALLVLSLAVNLGLLGWFKYSGLLAETASQLTGTPWDLGHWALPAGISFYTFQSLSYTIDVYRRTIAPIASFRDYAFFVSFFPQLVAGPIVRASIFMPQIATAVVPKGRLVGSSVALFCLGIVKKTLIADPLASMIVDPAFAEPLRYSSGELLLAVYAYAVQIYADFSGYSDMAIALAALLGFRIPVNFDRPYAAASITEFWRRWHISLSTWLRDYLYVPLGGNRTGRMRTYVNLLIVMLLGGMWHGAAWRFGLWGLWHGALLAVERATGWTKVIADRPWRTALGRVLTFHLVCFGWIFFRARSLEIGLQVLRQIAAFRIDASLLAALAPHQAALVVVVAVLAFHQTPVALRGRAVDAFSRGGVMVHAAVLAALLWTAASIQMSAARPFIYFQF